jgi:hypothetical protein
VPSQIPFIPGEPLQTVTIALDGVSYVLRARWNSSDDNSIGAWYLDAWERDGTTQIAIGIKLVQGVRLGSTYQHQLFSAGMFMLDTADSGVEAGLFDLGGRVVLVHMTTEDAIISAGVPAAELRG